MPGVSRPTADSAVLKVRYPVARGRVVLRGAGPEFDWERNTEPSRVDGDLSIFDVPVPPGETAEVKPYRVDGLWAMGRNIVLAARDVIEVAPAFERDTGWLLPWEEVPGAPGTWVRILLPPGYQEHTDSTHDVVYALDGQALWSDQQDPYGVWSLERGLDELWRLGVIEQVIVVSIHSGDDRLGKLGPVPDPKFGGGHAEGFLTALADVLVPFIDKGFRTRRGPEHRGLLGASMGGLFALFGAWRRPDVFGNAICLSSSFWWAERWMIHALAAHPAPTPRPRVYLDSGATSSPFEEDRNLRDGHHHTRAMMRALLDHGWEAEKDLHVLAFPGHLHDTSAWGARVSIPLQLLFASPT